MSEVRKKNSKNLRLFGENLRKIRIKKGISQEDLAYQAGISYTSVNRIEAGTLNTTIATCFELAKALEIPVKELFDF